MALQPNGLLTRLVIGCRLPIRQEAQVGEHRRVKTLLAALGTIAALATMALLVLGLSLLLGGRRAQPAAGVPSPTGGGQAEGATPFGQGVAELLANPPAAGETVIQHRERTDAAARTPAGRSPPAAQPAVRVLRTRPPPRPRHLGIHRARTGRQLTRAP